MPPLERRQQPVIAAAAVPNTDGASSDLNPKTIKSATAAAASKRRHLRQRRTASSASSANASASTSASKSTSTSSPLLSRKKNIVLNTRNPVIIFLAKHELTLSLVFMALVHACYWAGFEWPELWIRMQHKATSPSPASPLAVDRYVRGIHDFKFVFYWIVQLVAARSVLLHHIMPPVADALGIRNARKARRFCEMSWGCLYITASFLIGFRVWHASPYYMNTHHLYANYPEDHILMPYGLKWYYLVQTAFWLSNVYTIHVEERRKDHLEMMTHHVTTITLVLLSYSFHFTRFGHAFMLIMDFPDIFLSSAKMFRYLGYEMVPNLLFGVFSISWVVTKHYLCLKMMFSIWTQGTALVPHEKRFPHHPNSYASYPIAGFMWVFLLILQLVLIYWFALILKVLHRVLIKGQDADDNRSDDEDEDEDEDVQEDTKDADIDADADATAVEKSTTESEASTD
ncbi:Sphingosine N-acyltransferase lag1 [Coemansia erecta]|uniref:Sphingosine N-acyltransferase lag1 n=1 Tax=Coemansia erecta TaxID=147472 RepID=A0A9W8CQ55_9FUNG|nr:Sphingosine N-acyltransferase lag1 [Coemansia erecta]